MAYSHSSFSALNERLRPRLSASDRLYSSLYRMEHGYVGSLKPFPSTSFRQTILPPTPEPEISEAAAEPEEPREDAEQEVSTAEQACAEPSQPSEIQDKFSEDPEDEDSRLSPSEEKDVPGELVSKVANASTQSSTAKADNSPESSYIDGTLPDLIRSGRPLGRRRTLGHVSETVGRSKAFCPCLITEDL